MKTRRHAKILELIKAQDIDTQEELLRNLRACGFDVTQATVSRDIKELRLVKSLSPNGKYKYSTGRDNARDISSKFYSLFGDSVMSVEEMCIRDSGVDRVDDDGFARAGLTGQNGEARFKIDRRLLDDGDILNVKLRQHISPRQSAF